MPCATTNSSWVASLLHALRSLKLLRRSGGKLSGRCSRDDGVALLASSCPMVCPPLRLAMSLAADKASWSTPPRQQLGVVQKQRALGTVGPCSSIGCWLASTRRHYLLPRHAGRRCMQQASSRQGARRPVAKQAQCEDTIAPEKAHLAGTLPGNGCQQPPTRLLGGGCPVHLASSRAGQGTPLPCCLVTR